MKRELDNLSLVTITHRDQRLRSPQPWKRSKLRLWIVIVAIELLVVGLALLYFRHHHR